MFVFMALALLASIPAIVYIGRHIKKYLKEEVREIEVEDLAPQDEVTPYYRKDECEHEYIDPSNEVINANGYRVCVKCGKLESASLG